MGSLLTGASVKYLASLATCCGDVGVAEVSLFPGEKGLFGDVYRSAYDNIMCSS